MSAPAITAADFDRFKWDIDKQVRLVEKVADDLNIPVVDLLDAMASCGVKFVPAGHINIASIAYMRELSAVTR
jgi:hypothetical protein